ncbi:hypothetical protein PI95_005680 [Hassallia byssoidea VB512170]|uniref:Uncharacterized protein n=1 Tax=Hassallia byssoidea VB512170 TaxID=1304833 RepID=A0A846H4E3_9CYAN|nr:hypothetical protein [Hassalia byssoidea]NEU72075.1 hypothetical protein [Hassalia byssoidea VB512170]
MGNGGEGRQGRQGRQGSRGSRESFLEKYFFFLALYPLPLNKITYYQFPILNYPRIRFSKDNLPL